jgi:hypothetical protein
MILNGIIARLELLLALFSVSMTAVMACAKAAEAKAQTGATILSTRPQILVAFFQKRLNGACQTRSEGIRAAA